MKLIGLVGGISWSSTILYYKYLNELSNSYLKDERYARVVLYSLEYSEVNKYVVQNNWEQVKNLCAEAAIKLQDVGADFILLGSNTIHKVASLVEKEISVPLLSIIDATAKEVAKNQFSTVGLLGTNYTMQGNFFKDCLSAKYGINIKVPNKQDREFVHKLIYEKLVHNRIENLPHSEIKSITNRLIDDGVEAIILGCTELSLLNCQSYCSSKIFDTTQIHAKSAVDFALERI